ncbi:unnamed protein product [Gongylonema pulchrum]|uniref:WD_REPEATS_REGION domain-containing protein n=1 Tax=Gongylonema pulchrum TaxID=637853 RepID=A0A183E3T6_9BILA|nr:unnamed protein product [Gongylonema pulchrum]
MLVAHAVKVRAICFSAASDRLLTGSDDKIVKLYMIGTDKAQLVRSFCGHRSCVTTVRFHPYDIQIFASSSNDGSIILWNVAHDRPVHVFQEAHEGVELESSSTGLEQGYNATIASRDYSSTFNGFGTTKDDEEDELLARARRDLEGISDEEGVVL